VIKHWLSSDKKLSAALKTILGFYPGNIALYQMAFRHKSMVKKNEANTQPSNERLEFLGDAILGAVVAEYMFRQFPYKDEGFLTKMRSKVVSRHHLNSIALKMGFEDLLNCEGAAKGETSIYGNALEAFIGSIFLDKGITVTRKFILKRLLGVYTDMQELENKETDFKSKLIHWAQKEKLSIEFRVLNEQAGKGGRNFSVGVLINNVLHGQATGISKKRAEQLAAEKTWQAIEESKDMPADNKPPAGQQ
jgi:ribonuclease-3